MKWDPGFIPENQTWYWCHLKRRDEVRYLVFVDDPLYHVYTINVYLTTPHSIVKYMISPTLDKYDGYDRVTADVARKRIEECSNTKCFFIPLGNDSPTLADPAPASQAPLDNEGLEFFKGHEVTSYGAIPSAEKILILDEGFMKKGKGQIGYKLALLGDGWRWGTYESYWMKNGGYCGGESIQVGMAYEKTRKAAIKKALLCLQKRFALDNPDVQEFIKLAKRIQAAIAQHAAELGIDLAPALAKAQDPGADRPLPSPPLPAAAPAGDGRICPACTQAFTSKSKRAIYCSDTCRLRGHRHRKHGAPLPASPPPANSKIDPGFTAEDWHIKFGQPSDPRKALNMHVMDVKAGQLYGWSVNYSASVAKYTVAVAQIKVDRKDVAALYAQGVGRDAIAARRAVADMLYMLACTYGDSKDIVGDLRKEMALTLTVGHLHYDSSPDSLMKDLRLLGISVTKGTPYRVYVALGGYKGDWLFIVPHEGIYNIRAFFNNETVQISVASTDYVEATELLFARLLKYKIPIKPYEKSET